MSDQNNNRQVAQFSVPSIQELAYHAQMVEPSEFKEIIAAKSPSFRVIARTHGDEALRVILVVELTKICQLLAFSISGEMILECAKNIASEYWYCKLDDIKLFRSYLFKNKLPVEMYRNDALILYKLFEEYELVRFREFEQEKVLKYQKSKIDIPEPELTGKEIPMPDWFKELGENRMEAISERMRAEAMVQKAKSPNATVDQIAESIGLDPELVAKKIREIGLKRFNENRQEGETKELYLSYELGQVTFEARRDPEFLKKYIEL